MTLSEKVNKTKEDFLMEVNRLNYVIKLMDEKPLDLGHSSLTSAVRGVATSYEIYINSKIEFTEEYFKKDYWENLKKD
jgi:hypothetical protein